MIILNMPIRVKHIHRYFVRWFSDIIKIKRNNKSPYKNNLTFVYFSYAPDFDYIQLSIRSLIKNVKAIKKIYIFVDQKAPFNKEQITALTKEAGIHSIEFKPVHNFAWGSVESTKAEFECFVQVANEMELDDYLVKTDSDILFINSNKMDRLSQSGLPAVGDKHNEDFKYFQGGLYLMKMQVIKQCFEHISLDEIADIFKRWNGKVGEDIAVYQRLKDIKINTYDTNLMLFPDEYKKIKKTSFLVKWDYPSAHFVRDKESMKLHYPKLC